MNKLFIKTVFSIFLCIFIYSNSIQAQSQKSQSEYLSEIETLLDKSYERELFNGNVLVSIDNEIVYQKSFGFTDATFGEKLHKNSIFNIGSIAKQFNATSIMILHEKGQLNIDDPISKYNLDLPNWGEKVTLRHLLNYAGGLPKSENSPMTNDEVWISLRAGKSLLFEPGTDFNYNNNSVFLQKRIVEKVSGMTFQEFVNKNITKPLGMSNAIFDPKPGHQNRTSCFDSEKKACEEIEYHSGWLWVAAPDLLKWVEAINANTLITKESFDILVNNPYPNGRTGSNGQFFKETNLQVHDGSSRSFESIFFNDFNKNIKIIVLSNNKNIARKIGSLLHNIVSDKPYSIPKRSFVQVIGESFFESFENGMKAYNKLKVTNPDLYGFDDPSELNNLGYALMGKGKIDTAIDVFKLATQQFPEHANAYDSLGEGYFNNGQYDLALENYNKVLAISGTNENANKMIAKITEAKSK